jgi:hypothetical protein
MSGRRARNMSLRFIFVYLLDCAARIETCAGINKAQAEGALKHRIAATFPLRELAKAHAFAENQGARATCRPITATFPSNLDIVFLLWNGRSRPLLESEQSASALWSALAAFRMVEDRKNLAPIGPRKTQRVPGAVNDVSVESPRAPIAIPPNCLHLCLGEIAAAPRIWALAHDPPECRAEM